MVQQTFSFFYMIVITIFFLIYESASANDTPFYDKIGTDYSNLSSQSRLLRLGVGFLTMGAVANSDLDNNFQDWYQEDFRSEATDNNAEIAKLFGEGKYLLPITFIASGLTYLDSNSEIGKWGEKSARAYIVGLPSMWIMQNITGASRPSEFTGSEWRPFNDINGVSGHSFVSAVPFLTMARMTDNKFIKYGSYIVSTLGSWSRVNDNQHYLSQAILGWYMAYESVGIVFETNEVQSDVIVLPVINNDFYGVMVTGSW